MLWIITEDHINARVCEVLGEPIVTCIGKMVTHSAQRQTTWRAADEQARAALLQAWAAECTDEFRLLDDDGEVYYVGLCKDLEGQPNEAAFEPLDWSSRRDGCTTMQYRAKGPAADWKTL